VPSAPTSISTRCVKSSGGSGPRSRLTAVGQDPDKILKEMTEEFIKCEPKVSETKMGFRFLASPKRVLTDGHNRVRALEVEDNRLEPKGQDTAAVGLKHHYEFACDSVVFAVGDRVDDSLGLPYKNGVFVTNPKPSGTDPDDALFQAYDEATGKIVEGVFLTGWARKASEGLVGIAKRDGEWCAEIVTRYLESQPLRDSKAIEQMLHRLLQTFTARKSRVVRAADLRVLETAEKSRPDTKDCIGEFKFASTQEMLEEIQRRQALKPASV
jgi:ferredoxin/flavodoxin---NADP+ reductase